MLSSETARLIYLYLQNTTATASEIAAQVDTSIQNTLVEYYPFRTATVELDMRTADGVRIGTTAVWFLRELNRKRDSEERY
jgi:hypothetical protein